MSCPVGATYMEWGSIFFILASLFWLRDVLCAWGLGCGAKLSAACLGCDVAKPSAVCVCVFLCVLLFTSRELFGVLEESSESRPLWKPTKLNKPAKPTALRTARKRTDDSELEEAPLGKFRALTPRGLSPVPIKVGLLFPQTGIFCKFLELLGGKSVSFHMSCT